MTKEEFYSYQERAFDAFCMRTIHNAAISIHRSLAAQTAREIPLSSDASDAWTALWTEDAYRLDGREFRVNSRRVVVDDPELSLALQYITPQMREIILLSYFLEQSESEIGKMLKLHKSTVNMKKATALRRLREIIEAAEYD